MLSAIIYGFLFGVAGSVPMAGPIAALVLARVIEKRPRSGVAVAAGGALSETIYCLLAFWGFASVLDQNPSIVPISQCVTCPILLGLGVWIITKKNGDLTTDEASPEERTKSNFFLGLTIGGLNPLVLAGWAAAVSAAFSLGLISSNPAYAIPFSLSAGAGVLAWFAVLVFIVEKNRHRFAQKTLNLIMRIIGAVVIGFGIWVGTLAVRSVF